MEWEFIAPTIVGSVFFLSIAGVLIFRPLTKRLGDLIEITARNRQGQQSPKDLARVTELLGQLSDRVERLEERQEFTERILSGADPERGRAGLRTREQG